MEDKKRITSFKDLRVYQESYSAMLVVVKEIIPKLPEREKKDLADQMSRASKSIPRLIAEGYAKRHQRSGFHKYLDDAMAESNEMIVCVTQSKDLYPSAVDVDICGEMIETYDKIGRQLYKLRAAWEAFKPIDVTQKRNGLRNPNLNQVS